MAKGIKEKVAFLDGLTGAGERWMLAPKDRWWRLTTKLWLATGGHYAGLVWGAAVVFHAHGRCRNGTRWHAAEHRAAVAQYRRHARGKFLCGWIRSNSRRGSCCCRRCVRHCVGAGCRNSKTPAIADRP